MPGVKHVVQITDGVAVVADTYWQAKSALARGQHQVGRRRGREVSSDGIAAELKQAVDKAGAPSFKKIGDADAALKSAAKKVEAAYDVPYTAHVDDGADELHRRRQARLGAARRPDAVPADGARHGRRHAGMKPEQVKVRTTFLGGGFGRRIEVDFVDAGGADLEGRRRAGQADLVARRRHDARLLSADRAHQLAGRARRRGQAGGVQVRACRRRR